MRKTHFLILLFFSAITIVAIFFLIEAQSSINDPILTHRRIETPSKLVLNGYLGILTNFRGVGNINWLFLPLFFYILFIKKAKLQTWQKGLIVFFAFASILIMINGFFNERYQLTLIFVNLCILLYLIHFLFNKTTQFNIVIGFIVMFSFLNFCYYFYTGFLEKYKNRLINLVSNEAKSKQTIIEFINNLFRIHNTCLVY